MTAASFGKIVKYEDHGRNHPFVVYMALNKITGASYIGATQKGTRHRASIHLTTARSDRNGNQLIYRAIRKYGEENFTFITIKECVDFSDALESERSYIAFLKPRYNLTDGGDGVRGLKHSDISKERMSRAKIGKPSVWSRRPMPKEIRDKLAACRRAEKGRLQSEKQMVANAKLGELGNAARRKRVVCLNTGVVYPSLTSAGKDYSLTSGQISRLCKLGCCTRKGFRFAYEAT